MTTYEHKSSEQSQIRQRKNLRLPSYDYSSVGVYFITICSYDRQMIFGKIVNGEWFPEPFGMIVQDAIESLADHYEHVRVDHSVVMPNHMHMILWIDNGNDKSHTLGNIVRGFKSEVSRKCGMRVWQRGFYEHIVRNEQDLQEIRTYISNNPKKWEMDRHNPEHEKYASWKEPCAEP